MRHSIQSDHSYRIFTENAIPLLLIKSFLDLLNGTESIMSPNTSSSIVVYARPLHITPIKTIFAEFLPDANFGTNIFSVFTMNGVENRFRCKANSFAMMLRFKTNIKSNTHLEQTRSGKSNKNVHLQSLIYVALHIACDFITQTQYSHFTLGFYERIIITISVCVCSF